MFNKLRINPNILLAGRVVLATGTLALTACGGHHDAAASKGRQYTEIEQFGADTFHSYKNASGIGPHLDVHQSVTVDCLAIGPVNAAPSTEGKWYHITSPGRYAGMYAAANTFENGDTSGPVSSQPDVDPDVPNC